MRTTASSHSHIKAYMTLGLFNSTIKQWKPGSCTYRLYNIYTELAGYIKHKVHMA